MSIIRKKQGRYLEQSETLKLLSNNEFYTVRRRYVVIVTEVCRVTTNYVRVQQLRLRSRLYALCF